MTTTNDIGPSAYRNNAAIKEVISEVISEAIISEAISEAIISEAISAPVGTAPQCAESTHTPKPCRTEDLLRKTRSAAGRTETARPPQSNGRSRTKLSSTFRTQSACSG